jgi:hypothetical protein
LRFVRVEFAGYALTPDTKLNGFTCAGCGRGTTIEYLQVHRAADDGVELFGGTVNLKRIVITYAYDDGLDWEMGWQGKAQFVVVAQEPANGDAGYEADNLKDNQDAMPRSSPTICNATLVGSHVRSASTSQVQRAMVLRRGTAAHLFNHLVIGASEAAVAVRDAATIAEAESGNLFIRNSIFFENGADGVGLPGSNGGFSEASFFAEPTHANRIGVDPMLTDPYNTLAPNLLPRPGSPALAGGAPAPNDGFFEPTATFIGAFGDEDWTRGWTAFPAD